MLDCTNGTGWRGLDVEHPRPRGGRYPPFYAYAAQPGTGPAGFSCKHCCHSRRFDQITRVFWKCQQRHEIWTGGRGTDILANSPACARFHHQALIRPGGGSL